MGSFYLLDHPNPYLPQCRYPRRARLSGMVGVHTVECAMDNIGVDTGTENTAHYISVRPDYGSYHCICDSDSTILMAPDDYETWHIAADAHNWHSWGISAACRTTDWNPESEWTQRTIIRMGAAIAAFWSRNGFDPEQLAHRWLTREQALRHEPGLIEHGCAQPSDRSDAWFTRFDRGLLRNMLTQAILAAHRGTASVPVPQPKPEPIPEDDDMAKTVMVVDERNGTVWQVEYPDGMFKQYVETGEMMTVLTKTGCPFLGTGDQTLLDARVTVPFGVDLEVGFTLTPEQVAEIGRLTADEIQTLAHLTAEQTATLLANRLAS